MVATNVSLEKALALNDFCHRSGIAFIRTDIRGVFASVFTDFGASFTVVDVDGWASLPHASMLTNKELTQHVAFDVCHHALGVHMSSNVCPLDDDACCILSALLIGGF